MQLVTFRLANYETPLWAIENFVAGRYNHAGAGTTQYLSLHPMTPWAELLRNEDRRTEQRALLMRYPLWAIRVELTAEPLELSFENSSGFGLAPEDLVGDDQTPCRELADRFRVDPSGPRAFIAPSAALPGTRNLVVLEPRVLVGWERVPLDRLDWPGAIAAQDGRCPDGLWDLVHLRSAAGPHLGLQAWRDGEQLVFEEPSYVPDGRSQFMPNV